MFYCNSGVYSITATYQGLQGTSNFIADQIVGNIPNPSSTPIPIASPNPTFSPNPTSSSTFVTPNPEETLPPFSWMTVAVVFVIVFIISGVIMAANMKPKNKWKEPTF